MTTTTTAGSGRELTELRAASERALRTLGTVTLIGIGCGIFVVGVLSRLAMFLLIQLNQNVVGVTSDDGFEMGRFTLSGSLNLALLVGPLFGVVGAGFYVALRGLAIGPEWFRMLSLSLGPGVVIGSMLIHTDGVDFTLLDPLWLAVLLFILIPTAYVVLLRLLAERALVGKPWPKPLAYLGLAAWIPLLPGLLLLAAVWSTLYVIRQSDRGARFLADPGPAWAARGALALLFVAAVLDIVKDVRFIA